VPREASTHDVVRVARQLVAAQSMMWSSSSGPSMSTGWATRRARRGRRELTEEAGHRGGSRFGIGAAAPDGGGWLAVASDNPGYSCSSRGCRGVRER
jgi:hypothetical protein